MRGDRLDVIARVEIIEAVAARLPGALTHARAANVLRALYAAGYEVAPASQLEGAVEALEKIVAGHAAGFHRDTLATMAGDALHQLRGR